VYDGDGAPVNDDFEVSLVREASEDGDAGSMNKTEDSSAEATVSSSGTLFTKSIKVDVQCSYVDGKGIRVKVENVNDADMSIISSPFRLFKNRFKVQKDLPSAWAKEMSGGRWKDGNSLIMSTFLPGNEKLREKPKYTLVYADDFSKVDDSTGAVIEFHQREGHRTEQSWTQPPVQYHYVNFRIETCSVNHQKRKFRVRVEVNDETEEHLAVKFGHCYSNEIEVTSRPTVGQKRKMNARGESGDVERSAVANPRLDSIGRQAEKKMQSSAVGIFGVSRKEHIRKALTWAFYAKETLRMLQWSRVGLCIDAAQSRPCVDTRLPIFRCPTCFVYCDPIRGAQPHHRDCNVHKMIRLYENHLKRLEERVLNEDEEKQFRANNDLLEINSGTSRSRDSHPTAPRMPRTPSSSRPRCNSEDEIKFFENENDIERDLQSFFDTTGDDFTIMTTLEGCSSSPFVGEDRSVPPMRRQLSSLSTYSDGLSGISESATRSLRRSAS